MPAYTLSEVMSKATTRIGRRADISLSEASFWANAAYMEIAAMENHALLESSFLTSTVSGDSHITLPADFGEPISFTLVWSNSTASSAISSRRTLHRLSISDAEVQGPDPSGIPEAFMFFGDAIELVPSPNSAYSFVGRYRAQASDLTDPAAVPSLSTPWRHAWLLKTERYLFEYLGNAAGAAAAENRYLAYANALKSDEARRQSGELRLNFRPLYTGAKTGSRRSFDLW